MDLNPHLTHTDTVSHSLVPPTTLSSHVLKEMERQAVPEAKVIRGVGGGAGPWCYSNRKLVYQKMPISFLHTSKDLAEDTEPWGLGLNPSS